MQNILICTSHPDDFEISCAGFATKLLDEGKNVTLAIFACNEDRKLEQSKANVLLYKKYNTFSCYDFSLQDGYLCNFEKIIKNQIEQLITLKEIDTIITHFPKDTHDDHRTVSRAATDAGRKGSIIYFESPNVYEFEPNLYIELNKDNLDFKIELMKCHESQNKRNNNFYINKLKATAIFRGQAIYSEYAEGFHILRMKGI